VWFLNAALVVLSVVGMGAAVAYLVVRRTVRTVRRMPVIRNVPMIGVKPKIEAPNPDDDLNAYPERLARLESRLDERHGAVQDQMRLLADRRAEVAEKPDRADLVARYDEDIGHLDRRAGSMRRVASLVWRTRAILSLRVFLAITARKRPKLPALPESVSASAAKETLQKARAGYLDAAASVRFYVDEIDARDALVDGTVPAPLPSAEVDEAMRAAVERERLATRKAHFELRARMDRLADNLTWLADHVGTLQVVDDALEAPGAGQDSAAGHDKGVAHLLGEVNAAIAGLNALAGSVDHQLADRALDQLTDDVGQLEQQGLEEEAAAKAEMEVARLVEGFPA
jgi:hypothetical protein